MDDNESWLWHDIHAEWNRHQGTLLVAAHAEPNDDIRPTNDSSRSVDIHVHGGRCEPVSGSRRIHRHGLVGRVQPHRAIPEQDRQSAQELPDADGRHCRRERVGSPDRWGLERRGDDAPDNHGRRNGLDHHSRLVRLLLQYHSRRLGTAIPDESGLLRYAVRVSIRAGHQLHHRCPRRDDWHPGLRHGTHPGPAVAAEYQPR